MSDSTPEKTFKFTSNSRDFEGMPGQCSNTGRGIFPCGKYKKNLEKILTVTGTWYPTA